eukprot:CAMPEP_0178393486 /NCGR_PEP_ID=MMETSP0689_2-20121128/12213_1 /TAXON_ID=160604 /ORGANISM="Amphidinium massartii, Strain CS-259" /LENGTH=262 /DNA_ID=CAMNT_0020014081 /DNA_START=16 /DNA_END=804 /DNA_ORIENTATION=+
MVTASVPSPSFALTQHAPDTSTEQLHRRHLAIPLPDARSFGSREGALFALPAVNSALSRLEALNSTLAVRAYRLKQMLAIAFENAGILLEENTHLRCQLKSSSSGTGSATASSSVAATAATTLGLQEPERRRALHKNEPSHRQSDRRRSASRRMPPPSQVPFPLWLLTQPAALFPAQPLASSAPTTTASVQLPVPRPLPRPLDSEVAHRNGDQDHGAMQDGNHPGDSGSSTAQRSRSAAASLRSRRRRERRRRKQQQVMQQC